MWASGPQHSKRGWEGRGSVRERVLSFSRKIHLPTAARPPGSGAGVWRGEGWRGWGGDEDSVSSPAQSQWLLVLNLDVGFSSAQNMYFTFSCVLGVG